MKLGFDAKVIASSEDDVYTWIPKITKDDIASLLRSSLARYEAEQKADTRKRLFREGIASETQAAQLDDNAIRFNIKTEESVEQKIRDFAKTKEGQKLGWTDAQIESIISDTADLMRAIHAAVSGDKYYDEWAEKVPTIKVDWRERGPRDRARVSDDGRAHAEDEPDHQGGVHVR